MRITMIVRNTKGLEAKLRARTKAQKQRVLEASQDLGEDEHAEVVVLANRLTGYMVTQTKLRFTRGGYNYLVGYFAEDFIGQENPVTGQLITRFYPVDVIYGTRFYAGNDFLTKAHRLMYARIRAKYAAALQV